PVGSISSTTLKKLNISSNKLSGSLPTKVGHCAIIDLSNNMLSGNLSRIRSWGNYVEEIQLSSNSLTGTLPNQTSQFLRLTSFKVSNNALEGVLSPVLGTYPELKVIDLSLNHLNGFLLPSFFNSGKLTVLNLSGNKFTGLIPLQEIQTIDSTQNRSLMYLNLSNNSLSGNLPPEISKFRNLVYLDLSNNKFEGSIPADLPALLKGFNASFNNLSGVVPENLQRFPDSAFHPGNSLLVLPYSPLSSEDSPDLTLKKHRSHMKPVIRVSLISGLVGAALMIALFGITIYYRGQWQECEKNSLRENEEKKSVPQGIYSPDKLAGELHLFDGSLGFTAEELSRAQAEVVGRSCHGILYKATLDSGHLLAVKWLREGIAKGRTEFSREVKKLGNIKHPNLVSLQGYYWGSKVHEKLIISHFVNAECLALYLQDYDRIFTSFFYVSSAETQPRRLPLLSLDERLRISVDVARCLNYLHNERAIPHGNLKSTNILIETPNMNALLTDYSLHRILTPAGTAEQVLNAGALGYRPPEFASSSKPCPSLKSDVYAFGVILLELLTGKSSGEIISGDPRGVDLTESVRLFAAKNRYGDCFDR
ncbi:LRR_1 domain-containing protein/Pkinase_Tyr domain-containing protein/LRR_4 domain-containing protein, partial [Cephalotus follicularis]